MHGKSKRCFLVLAFVFAVLTLMRLTRLSSQSEPESQDLIVDVVLPEGYNGTTCTDQPMDLVYTWVNGSDVEFLKLLDKYILRENQHRGGKLYYS